MLSDPLVATLLGVVVLHEPMPASGVLGVLLVLTGLALQARSSTAEPAPTPTTQSLV